MATGSEAAPKDISDSLKELTISSSEKSVGREIGRGAYSRVFTVEYDGSICAAREIHSYIVEGVGIRQIRENIFQECHHCSVLSHPNIVSFVGISNLSSGVPLMIMELMDASLDDYISKLHNCNCDCLKYREARCKVYDNQWKMKYAILRDAAKGLVYLHEQRPAVVHGDLSPRNILLKIGQDKVPVAKIGDLGVARIVKADSKATQSMLTQVSGSVDFMPPESCGDRSVYGTATDTFSYGCIMLFVATHKWPYWLIPSVQMNNNLVTKKSSEVERRQEYLLEMTRGEDEWLGKIIRSCLSDDPSERPEMAAVADKVLLKVIILTQLTDRRSFATVKEGSLVCNLCLQISERLAIPVDHLHVKVHQEWLDSDSTETLEYYKIKDFTQVYVISRIRGGGDPTNLYSYFDDCSMKHRCPFHELFSWKDIYEFSQKQENAYNLLCRKFNLSNEVIRAIKDNNEQKHIRLGDVLHRIYHKDPSITWLRITEMVSSSNAYNCTCM